MANTHQAYINKTTTGGTDAYAENQRKRYQEAQQKGDADLINRLNADAQRVGYSLTQPKAVAGGMTEYVDNQGTQWRVQNGVETNMSAPNLDQIYAQQLAQQQSQQAALLEEQKRAAEAALRAKVDQGVNRLQGSKTGVDQTYSQSARQAYILNEKNKAQMPQQMAAMGISGGLAQKGIQDTSLAYQNAQNQGALARDNQIAAIDQDINNLRSTGDISIAENAANYAQRLAEELAASQQRLQEQSNWQAEFDARQAEQEASTQSAEYQNRLALAQYLAKLGDFTGLRALGIDTSQIEAQYLADQQAVASKTATQSGKVATPKVNNYTQASNIPQVVNPSNLAPYGQEDLFAQTQAINLANQGKTPEEIANIMNATRSLLSWRG